jgi:hypothetical protein
MRSANLVLVLLAALSFFYAAVLNKSADDANQPLITDYGQVNEIIRVEDNPERLSKSLGASRYFKNNRSTLEFLRDLIEYNRLESLKFFLPRCNLDYESLKMLLEDAIVKHNLRICSYLLSLETVPLAVFQKIWEGVAHWNIGELKNLALFNQILIVGMIPYPSWLLHADCAASVWKMIKFVDFCRYLNDSVAESLSNSEFGFALAVIENKNLSDEDRALMLDQIIGMGEGISRYTFVRFRNLHPNYVDSKSYKVLVRAYERSVLNRS